MRTLKTLPVAVFMLLCMAASPATLELDISPLQQLFIMKEVKPGIERVGVLVNKETAGDEAFMTQLNRASAASGIKVFMANVSSMQDIAPMFRQLQRDHKIQGLWIAESEGVLNNDVSRSFLIKETTEKGMPLFAPTAAWVNEGAPLTLEKVDGDIQLVLNKAAAAAGGLVVPDKYQERTRFLASN